MDFFVFFDTVNSVYFDSKELSRTGKIMNVVLVGNSKTRPSTIEVFIFSGPSVTMGCSREQNTLSLFLLDASVRRLHEFS